jgi:hypothetical protein
MSIVDASRDDGKRFVVHAGEKLTAFLELESAIRDGCEFFLPTEQDFCELSVAKRI